MKVGYTVWEWMLYFPDGTISVPIPGNTRDLFEQSLKDLSDLGYETIENFEYMLDYYQDAEDEFDSVMKKYNLKFANLYHYMTDDFDTNIERTKACVEFCKRHDIHFMNLQAPFRESNDLEVDIKSLEEVCKRANIMGRLAKDADIDICLHPHFGTVVYYQNEIDFFAENTDSSCVNFCIDTSHSTIAGIDPVALINKYIRRVKYMHLKDVFTNPNGMNEELIYRFAALGQGTVDFRGVFDVLRDNNYDGIVCVECDYPLVNNYQSAQYSRNYLHHVIGI